MTREEAIKELSVEYLGDSDKIREAKRMAIKALENEPRFLVHSDGKIEQIIEPCDNCVSRQALLEFFKDDDYVVNEINNMPSVLPKREHGEWIDCQDEGYVECPICGSATNCDDNKEDLHYCFSCGAEMR